MEIIVVAGEFSISRYRSTVKDDPRRPVEAGRGSERDRDDVGGVGPGAILSGWASRPKSRPPKRDPR
jgi:hypothetical protein